MYLWVMRITAPCLLIFLLHATARLLGAQASLETEIRTQVARYVEAVNSGDGRALADLYARSPGVSSIGECEITRGWADILRLIENVYGQVDRIAMRVDSVTVMSLGRGAAAAYFPYSWTLGSGRDAPTLRGAMTLLYQRTAKGWQVVHDHTSTLPEEGASEPAAVLEDRSLTGPVRETERCVVTRIVDGDTFDCRGGPRVRLIGIDTPELSQVPYGAQASEALAELMPVGTEVALERDVELRDRYGRRLAYVWRDGAMVNWAMVRNGWAVLLTYPPNVQYVDRFEAAERAARAEGVGLWSVGGFECAPSDRRRGRCD